MEMIESQTKDGFVNCIKFVERKNQPDWIQIKNLDGCNSKVGLQGGLQVISLNKDRCLGKSTVAHELIHALGFGHEQSRPDRNDYIQVYLDNIGLFDLLIIFKKIKSLSFYR